MEFNFYDKPDYDYIRELIDQIALNEGLSLEKTIFKALFEN